MIVITSISGKPHLQQQIALFEFSDDHRGLTILRIISEKIPQTELDDDVITRIRQLLDTMDKLEQEKKCIGDCIGFLKFKASSILPVEPMTSLYDYASKVVKTKEEYLGRCVSFLIFSPSSLRSWVQFAEIAKN